MADLTSAPPKQQMRGSGFAALFGLFFGLCAIFAGGVALSDWYGEVTQARWPLVSAVVDRSEVVVWERDARDGSRTSWHLKSRVQFEVDGKLRTLTLTSSSFFSEADSERLQSWAERHGSGSEIDVRYDPSREDRAVFASAELSSVAARIRNDLMLFSIAAIACAALLALSKILRAREARVAPDTSGRALGLGLVVAALGATVSGAATYRAIHAVPFAADNWMGVPAGLIFLIGGILLTLPPEYNKWRNWLATLLISCFALTFDWVAFGPGEREFGVSINGFGLFIPGEMVGRAAFGFFGVMVSICAAAMWIGQFRQLLGLKSSGWFMEQKL
jgi:hypothetical protein